MVDDSSSDSSSLSPHSDDDSSEDEDVEGDELNLASLSTRLHESNPASADATKTRVASFASLGLGGWLCSQLSHLALTRPTPVQVGLSHSTDDASLIVCPSDSLHPAGTARGRRARLCEDRHGQDARVRLAHLATGAACNLVHESQWARLG